MWRIPKFCTSSFCDIRLGPRHMKNTKQAKGHALSTIIHCLSFGCLGRTFDNSEDRFPNIHQLRKRFLSLCRAAKGRYLLKKESLYFILRLYFSLISIC